MYNVFIDDVSNYYNFLLHYRFLVKGKTCILEFILNRTIKQKKHENNIYRKRFDCNGIICKL